MKALLSQSAMARALPRASSLWGCDAGRLIGVGPRCSHSCVTRWTRTRSVEPLLDIALRQAGWGGGPLTANHVVRAGQGDDRNEDDEQPDADGQQHAPIIGSRAQTLGRPERR